MARQAKTSTIKTINPETQAKFRQVFEASFTTMESFLGSVLKPVFGAKSFEQGYTELIKTYPEVKCRADASHITSINHTGTFDIAGQELKVFEIILDDRANLRRARVNIQRVVRSFLDTYERALIVFHYEQPQGRSWRLSYVEKRTSGKDSTSAKRFTYLFGPGYSVRTAAERFAKLEANKDIRTNDITEAFSVQSVTKEFYTKLYSWYEWAQSTEFNVTFPSNPETNEDDRAKLNEDLIRLITRLIFVWFIKQKQLVAEELFNPDKLRIYLKEFEPNAGNSGSNCNPQCEKTTNYYHAILQNLFFATLNKQMDERKFAYDGDDAELRKKEYGIKTLYRYGDLFTEIGLKEIRRCFDKTPFLNGGLFECLDKSELMSKNENRIIYYDGFSRNKKKNGSNFACRAFIPNVLFFNEDEKHPGLITLLKQYNFTVEENTADDTAVALDPELLGKVFENLLASYNPETRETARNATGSFYTPREIVRYMVETSLCEHIKTKIAENKKVKIEPDVIDRLVHEDTCPEELKGNKEVIKEILLDTKVLDPACGSGAFPMGVMQCMMEILHKLDPSVDDRAYDLKKRIIEKCLYGVDIQTIAVQISKLRCFISLIVEETPDESKPNLGLPPLPNLETRFVAANSLIPLKIKTEKNPTLFDLAAQDVNKEKNNLKRIRHEHFNAPSYEEKKRLREEDKASRERLAQLFKKYKSVASEDIERILKWDPYDQNQSSEFFDPEWMFDVSDGFDIVIGNPPYGVSIQGDYRNNVECALGHVPDYEIYYYFIEIAKKLCGANACLSYIIPNTWLFNTYATEYRKSLLNRWNVTLILDCSQFKLFEKAEVRNTIIFLKQSAKLNNITAYYQTKNIMSFEKLIAQDIENVDYSELLLMNQNWGLVFKLDKKTTQLICKLSNNNSLQTSFPDISQGLIAYDKYRGQSQEIIASRAYHYNQYHSGLKEWLWGEDVTRFCVKWNGKEWIDYCKGIANPRNPKYFVGRRLLIREITNPRIFAAITDYEMYNDPAILIVKDSPKYSIIVLLAIFNSKLATFYHFNHSPKSTKGAFPKILIQDVKDFPIPTYSPKEESALNALVNQILKAKSTNPNADTSALEHEIDQLVYELYDLTPDEIAIVEGEISDSPT
jgi:predicted RNA methylase